MKKNKTNIYVIRNTINKNLVRKGYSMQASYFQTDNGYIDYVYTDLEKDELVFVVIAEKIIVKIFRKVLIHYSNVLKEVSFQ